MYTIKDEYTVRRSVICGCKHKLSCGICELTKKECDRFLQGGIPNEPIETSEPNCKHAE